VIHFILISICHLQYVQLCTVQYYFGFDFDLMLLIDLETDRISVLTYSVERFLDSGGAGGRGRKCQIKVSFCPKVGIYYQNNPFLSMFQLKFCQKKFETCSVLYVFVLIL